MWYLRISVSFWGGACIENCICLLLLSSGDRYLTNWDRKKHWTQSELWVFTCSRLQILCERAQGGSGVLLAVVSIDEVAPCERERFLVRVWLKWFANAINLQLPPLCAVATALVSRKSWRQYLGVVGCCIPLQCKYSSKSVAFSQVISPNHGKRSGALSRQSQRAVSSERGK